MLVVTLVKAVPDLDAMSFDPATNTARRQGVELFLNPFDARAALVAPTLARPGDSTLVVSMGPPTARGPLLEALAMGSDRAVLVSDAALAGSDTWVTSKVLAAVLRPIAPDVVLTGRWSTDSSTGHVPSQLAERLGFAMVNAARAIERRENRTLAVVGETEDGWARYEVPMPCLVTVGEKIVKMRAPSPEARAAAEGRPFETRSIDALGLRPAEVGLAGSPTLVAALRNDEPLRAKRVFATGAASGRVRAAAAAIRGLSARNPPRSVALRPLPDRPVPSGEVLVFVSRAEGGLDPHALPLVSEVLRMPAPLYPSAVGFGPLSEGDRRLLSAAGALRAYWSEADARWRPAEVLTPTIGSVLRRRANAVGALFVSTAWSRELAGRLSAREGLGLVGDAVGISWDPNTGLVYTKPSFGGGLSAQVVSRRRPALATVRRGQFEPGPSGDSGRSLDVVPVPFEAGTERLRRVDFGVERDPRFGDLDTARVVVVVGMGIGGPGSIPEVLAAIRPLGAALAATRKVVDAGWLPPQLQVGLTGTSVAPELYLAVGLSGKANHLVGAKRARVAVGINSNENEPLFDRVDVGLVGDWRDLLSPLVRELAHDGQHPIE
jgi:electron transfer flavoprotein alpha subunit